MTDEPQAPGRTPLQALAAHWVYPLILIPLCTLAGAGLGNAQAPLVTAETRLAVGPGPLSTGEVTAFPQAARTLAQEYSRWVVNSAVDGTLGGDRDSSVTASPIPESGVIRIEAQSRSADTARRAADNAAVQLMEAVSNSKKDQNPAAAFAQYSDLAKPAAEAELTLTQAQAAYAQLVGAKAPEADIQAAGQAVVAARIAAGKASLERDAAASVYSRLRANASSASELKRIGEGRAVITGDTRKSQLQRYGVGGLGVGAALSIALAMSTDRRRRRRLDPAAEDLGRPSRAPAAVGADGAGIPE